MKRIIYGFMCLFLLVGCSQVKEQVETQTTDEVSSTDSLNDTFYSVITRDINTTRDSYYTDFGQTSDFKTIGRELELLSIPHFPTDTYYKAEGQYVGVNDFNQLLKRADDVEKYPYTLQPQKGTTLEGVVNPVMVGYVYEQDFYIKSGDTFTIKGLSLAIVIDPSDESGNRVTMQQATINSYGEECIKKLYTYLRTKKELNDVPLNITVYQATNPDESLIGGRYILSSYCENSVGKIKELNYKNVIFTSSEAEQLDITTYSEFVQFKSLLKNNGTEAVGVIGYGRYKDDELQSLLIELNLNVKTYSELIYIVSIAAEDLNNRFSQSVDIRVVVNSQDGLSAVIIKERGEDAKSNLLY